MTTDSVGKMDARLLVDEMLPLAKKTLVKFRELHPFGGYLKRDGSLLHVGVRMIGPERGSGTRAVESMIESFRRLASKGTVRATAIVCAVRIV